MTYVNAEVLEASKMKITRSRIQMRIKDMESSQDKYDIQDLAE